MFKTIVVGTDGSGYAGHAIRVAADLAKHTVGAKVHVVAAYRPLGASELRDLAAELPEEVRSTLTTHARAEGPITDARAILYPLGVDAEYHEVGDDATEAILEIAEQEDADLIVVGSRGEGAAKRALHGSVSTKVVHHAHCAVLVTRNEA